ncbi:MAG: site-specific DNA-methyltransferase [Synergistaceae bacterium]|nr:site-specific DNA-methyltransferase [Synergistaceae bacterium]
MTEARELYAFTWPGKREAILEAGRPIDKVLRPCVEESVNFEATENLYIEGDNLEAMKILQRSYMRKVKMIYIDPPYNTGHDFIYSDDFAHDEEEAREEYGLFDGEGARLFTVKNYRENTRANPRYHSDWCSMIYPRLMLARNLLSDDGIIFISIDDNEVPRLRMMCDEIFGEDNFRNQIVVRRGAKSVQAQFDTLSKLGQDFEYILLYTKNSEYRFPKQLRPLEDEREGKWSSQWRGTDRPTMRYELFGITPKTGQWRWSKERSEAAIKNYNIMLSELKTDNPTQAQIDEWYNQQSEDIDLLRLSVHGKPENYIPATTTTLLNSSWMDLLIGSSSEIMSLFDAKVFDTAKLTAPIMRMLNFVPNDAVILDFFSGSSTTAHAVMSLNAQDGGTRKFIMIQLPDPCPPSSEAAKSDYSTIADIGRERIRRAGNNIVSKHPLIHPDTGFRTLRVDSTNFRDVFISPDDLESLDLDSLADNLKPDRSPLDLLFMCITDSGLPLSLTLASENFSGFTILTYGDGEIIACFDSELTEEVITHIAKQKPNRAIFRDSAFQDSRTRINLEQIFSYYAPDSEMQVL